MIVRVPGSSANLGPGFDSLAVAVGRYAWATDEPGSLERARPADEHHPADIAYRSAGGRRSIEVITELPMGRGLGYSGAARVAGAVLGLLECSGTEVVDDTVRAEATALTAELEGHPENVAASAFGGAVVAVGGEVVRIPLAVVPALVVWIPSFTTSTDASRRTLPAEVSLGDAAFNVGRAALLVAALTTGRTDVLRTATEDRLHQPRRLAAAPPSAAAIDAALAAGAWAAWLSGSGPTVAAFVDPSLADAVIAALPAEGTARLVTIDQTGAAPG